MALGTFNDLNGASVFVTGGGSGIGAAITDAFLAQGAMVAFVGRSDASAFCAEMERKHGGNRPLFIQTDITDTAKLGAAIDESSSRHGAVSVLVNNAANDQRHNTLEVTEAFWDAMMAVNLRAYFFASQAVIPGMRSKGRGSIINLSSITYLTGIAGLPIYVTANAGIVGLTRSLAREFGPDGIRVNALAPGWVMTEKQKELWVTEEALQDHLAKQCLKWALAAEDIAGGVLFLASGMSRAMTSQCMVIDGGVAMTG
jgi:NAD(P)-dependent dehydrogenase (short-subunit alcohol dehydrogenase family)